jgi:hypothetical protein
MLLKAQVVDNTDFSARGRILVYCKDLGQDYFYVIYVSPYGANFEGGIIAVPEIGTEILIQQSDGHDQKWYYIGSIFEPKEGLDGQGEEFIDAQNTRVPEKEVYRARGRPQQLVLKDPSGNKLILSNASNPEYFNTKAELQSALGKKLILSDSVAGMDCAILENEHGDGLKITTRAHESSPARAAELESAGPVKVISRESEVEIMVVEGRDIDIVNFSTGLNTDAAFPKRAGNINITSMNNDVNITTEGFDGRVFIKSKGANGLVQLDADGSIIIFSNENVEIRGAQNMKLSAGGNIGIEAGGNIDMKAGANVSLEAGAIANIRATTMFAADALQIHLNSLLSTPATPNANVTKVNNNYD